MKCITLKGNSKVQVNEIPEPELRTDDDVKIRIHGTNICSGDLMWYEGEKTNVYLNDGIGHEFSGTVVEAGRSARMAGFVPGARVSGYPWMFCGKCPFCKNGMENMCASMPTFVGSMTEYIVLNQRQVCLLPDEVSLEAGSLFELVSNSLNAIDRAGVVPGKTALITGGGGDGLVLLQLLQRSGAVQITVAEPLESKRLLAKKLGADHVIDPARENLFTAAMRITNQMGYDYIFDAASLDMQIDLLPSLLAKRGTLVLVWHRFNAEVPEIRFNPAELYVKEATVTASYFAPYMMGRTAALLPKLELEALIGARYPIDKAQAAFDAAASKLYPRVFVFND